MKMTKKMFVILNLIQDLFKLSYSPLKPGRFQIKSGMTLLFFSTLILLPNHTSAEEQFPFIGTSISYHDVKLDAFDNTTHTTASFHVGRQTLRWRTTFSLEYGNDYGAVGVNVDYIPFDTLFGTPRVRPYLGMNINYLHYENDDIDDSNGYSYGGQAGFIIYASDTVDIDIGYHYDKVDSIEGIDNIQGATLSIHYFY